MKLEEKQIEKADPLLQEALKKAKGDEIIRTIMLLGGEAEAGDRSAGQEPDPEQFADRASYRRALIENRERQISHQLGDVMRELRGRALKLTGGTISPTVVVEGAAREILRSLDLPGVRHASLDRAIKLDRPSRGRGAK